MQGCLFVVATPIGNLADMSLRAQQVLASVDRILVEDSRHSRKLLQHYNITTRVQALHEHNEQQLISSLLMELQAGKSFALISDAGTPLISDPGYRLVSLLREEGITVSAIPGPCALIAALSISGLPSDSFCFQGFLPAKTAQRQQALQFLVKEQRTLIFYESVHRIKALLTDVSDIFPSEREVFIARELSKQFESGYKATAASAVELFNEENLKGEFVVLIAGFQEEQDEELPDCAKKIAAILAAELPVKQAARLAAAISGEKKNKLYHFLIS